jgi:hypothetical protein
MTALDTTLEAAFSADFQSLQQFPAFLAIIEQSSVLIADIENLIAANGNKAGTTNENASIVLGKPGGGTFAGSKIVKGQTITQITIDPDLFENLNQSGILNPHTLDDVAVALGHELGHATLTGGLTNYLSAPSAAIAANTELGDEGVAETNAYFVGKQLNTDLPGSATEESDLNSVVTADGFTQAQLLTMINNGSITGNTTSQLLTDLRNKATSEFVHFSPSGTQGFTYPLYYGDEWVIKNAAGDISKVNWDTTAHTLAYTSNTDGSTSVSGYVTLTDGTIETISGTFGANGKPTSVTATFSDTVGGTSTGTATFTTNESGQVQISTTGQVANIISGGAAVSIGASAQAVLAGANDTITVANGALLTLSDDANDNDVNDADGFASPTTPDSNSDNNDNIILEGSSTVIDDDFDPSADTITFGTQDGKGITFGPGTLTATEFSSSSNTVNIALTLNSDLPLGTLTLNTSTDADSFKLVNGTVVPLPGVSGNITLSAPTSPTETPLQAIEAYLSDLGFTGNLTTYGLSTSAAASGDTASLYGNNTITASGTGQTLIAGFGVDTLNGYSSGSTSFDTGDGLAYGTTLTGHGTGNTLYAAGDITGATLSGIQTLYLDGGDGVGSGGGVVLNTTLTSAQYNGFTTITDPFSVNNITLGDSGTYSISTSKLAAASGDGQPDSFALQFGASGTTTANVTQSSSEGFTPTQYDITGSGNITLNLTGLGNDNLSITGNGTDAISLVSSDGGNNTLAIYGIGDDAITAGNGNNDILTTSGSGSSTLTAGSGNDDQLTANTGGNTLVAGNGAGDSFTAQGGDNTITAGNGGGSITLWDADNIATATGGDNTFNLEGPSSDDTGSFSIGASVLTGGATGSNSIEDDYDGNLDISEASLTHIQSVTDITAITMTAAQFSGFSSISFDDPDDGDDNVLTAATSGTYDLATVDTSDAVTMVDAGVGGVTFIANAVEGDQLVAEGSGDTLTSSTGGDVFVVEAGASATATGAGSGNTFYLAGDATVTGGSGGGTTYLYVSGSDTINDHHTSGDQSTLAFESLDSTDVTLMQAGNNLYIETGNGQSVTVENYFLGSAYQPLLSFEDSTTWDASDVSSNLSGSATLVSSGSSESETVSSTNFLVEDGSTLTLEGSSSDDSIAANATNATVSDNSGGSGNSFTDTSAGSGNLFNLNGGSNTATLYGSGETVNANGDNATITDASGSTGNTINLNGGSETVTLAGSDDTLNDTGSGSSTMTLSGDGSWAYVGSYDSTVTVSGNGGGLSLTGPADTGTLSGNDATADLSGSIESATITGSNDMVNDDGNSVTLSGTDGTVTLSGEYASATLSGTGDSAIITGTSANVTVNEDNATVTLTSSSSSSSVTLNGLSDTVVDDGSGNTTTVNSTPESVTVGGSNGTLWDWGGSDNYTLTGDGLYALLYGSDSTATLSGDGAGIQLAGDGESGTLSGTNESVTLDGSGETATVTGDGGTADDYGSGDTVTMSGTGSTANVYSSGQTVSVSGANSAINLSSDATSGSATIGGTNDTITVAGTSSESIIFNDDALVTLLLQNAQNFSGTVAGLAANDKVDFADFLFSGTPTISNVTGTGATGTNTVVTITDDGVTAQLALLNQYTNQFAASSAAYTLTADGTQPNAGTLLQLAAAH